ncbi:VCBS repeat-containing protein [Maribacter spongiicola]|uniref:VCBS repeat-containing protein n=1 Tax=Maribacter spongiicola TaxID=1206753 RepID=UPI003F9AA621
MKNTISTLKVIFAIILFVGCNNSESKKLYYSINYKTSGLDFNNQLIENDSINILDNEFVYNGAGVAIADVNADGLDDIFLTGNQVNNRLYLNQGNLKFKDISIEAQISKKDTLQWSSGVTILDINLDGLQDIYICNTFRKDSTLRKNLLYINQGNNDNNIPLFIEEAAKYGLDDPTYSSHAQFFDYDNDGDLDVFIGVNRIEGINPNEFSPLTDDGTSKSKDVLYENVFIDSLNQRKFIDVSEKAGIRYHGYSHSTLINDFNNDGYADIYVANDFLSNDLIYINNQDGTFSNKAGEIFKHFSLSSMGSDIADVNNDGLMDIFTTEMQPYYNKRKKLFQGPSNYQKEIFTKKFQYEHQYTRNTLQQNLGINPENGLPIFSEIGMFAGVQETDWSWAPLFADVDNDGWKDLLITNGFPKDVTDRDFGDFRITASRLVPKEQLIEAIPEIKIPNFIFKNNNGNGFIDQTKAWGLDYGTFSNGAAYGDLDNDGDLDLVINNINDKVLLLQNRLNEINPNQNYLRVKLKGIDKNKEAIGSSIIVYYGSQQQRQSLLSGRGYLSQPEKMFHVGLGTVDKIDSLKIIWPNGKEQIELKPEINKDIEVTYNPTTTKVLKNNIALFKKSDDNLGLNHFSKDLDFIDFNFQTTIPHKFSQYGPSISVGDINGDNLEDMFIVGSRGESETWFIQTEQSTFIQKNVAYKSNEKLEEDSSSLLFDVDNDGDLDLYIARGSAQYPSGNILYKDQLLLNDGKGNFTDFSQAIPDLNTNTTCVKAADFDNDGDLDLFVGGRVLPFAYPSSDRSYIFENQSEGDNIKFVDVTVKMNPKFEFAGLVSDAIWTDFNNDFWPDLIIASEWMPLRFFANRNGKLVEITEDTGIQNHLGWWNSLTAGDFDNDGDIDYIAGNFGRNINFQGDTAQPIRLYAKDLDGNGSIDPLLSYYLRDSLGTKKEYLYHPWQDVTKQYVGIRKKFNSFGEFGSTTLPEMFNDGLLDDATKLTFNEMETSLIENIGNGKFVMRKLPSNVQHAPIYGMLSQDIDEDNLLDIVLVGNDFGMEVQQGMADALVGLILKNTGNLNMKSLNLAESNFYVSGDAKALVNINLKNGKELIIASQNNDSIKVHEYNTPSYFAIEKFLKNEVKAIITFKDGKKRIQEVYWGDSFNSQSNSTISITKNITEINFYNNNGEKTRTLKM